MDYSKKVEFKKIFITKKRAYTRKVFQISVISKLNQSKHTHTHKRKNIKTSMEINDIANRETMGKLMKPKIGSLKVSV